MTDWLRQHVDDHIVAARQVFVLRDSIWSVGSLLCEAFAAGRFVYTFGNGGSAADAQHLTGELIGRYQRNRRPLPAVTLSTDPSVTTCIANDYSAEDVFARQVEALARRGDVVVGFTTSGRSPNVVAGLRTARGAGATTVLFSGGDGGAAAAHADHALLVPSTVTARIQEAHTLMLHLISEMVDRWAAGEESSVA